MHRPLKMAALLLSVHPLPDQCPLHLYSTHSTDLPTYLPQAPASDCSFQRGGEGRAPLLVSLVTNEPTWRQFPYNWPSPHHHPQRPRSKDGCHVLPAICHTWWWWGVAPGPCFRSKLPHPLNHWCLCRWALSLVLKLDKYRPYRSAGCCPTELLWKMRELNTIVSKVSPCNILLYHINSKMGIFHI